MGGRIPAKRRCRDTIRGSEREEMEEGRRGAIGLVMLVVKVARAAGSLERRGSEAMEVQATARRRSRWEVHGRGDGSRSSAPGRREVGEEGHGGPWCSDGLRSRRSRGRGSCSWPKNTGGGRRLRV